VFKTIPSFLEDNKCSSKPRHCYPEKIFPCPEACFFDWKLRIDSRQSYGQSPWFYCGRSDRITFFVRNNGCDAVIVRLEISPDGENVVEDGREVCIHPHETAEIIPHKFAKFIRVVVCSQGAGVDCELWHQAQLRCVRQAWDVTNPLE